MRTSRDISSPRARTTSAKKPRNKWLTWIAAIALVALIALVAWPVWKYQHVSHKIALEPRQAEQVHQALVKQEPNAPVQYILFLGGDMRPGQTRGRSDTMMVARLDPQSRKVDMVSIPRDTRVPIPGHGVTKINAALAYGGPALAIQTVKAYTGLPINHFIFIDFRGFANMVDMMGGVVINVDKAIDDKNGATTGGISNVTHIPAGLQKLDGRQALTYVRSRKFADGDFTRIRHQQALLMAVARDALSSQNVGKLSGLIDVASNNMKSDMDLVSLSKLARLFKDIDDKDVTGMTLPGVPQRIDGVSYVIPDLNAKKRIVTAFMQGRLAEMKRSAGK